MALVAGDKRSNKCRPREARPVKTVKRERRVEKRTRREGGIGSWVKEGGREGGREGSRQ